MARATIAIAYGARATTASVKSICAAAWPITHVGNGASRARISSTTWRDVASPGSSLAGRTPIVT